jgi:hypothetical protein
MMAEREVFYEHEGAAAGIERLVSGLENMRPAAIITITAGQMVFMLRA